MTSTGTRAGSRLDIGKVIEETFAVSGRNFATFGLAALILVGIPSVLIGMVQFGQPTPTAETLAAGAGSRLGLVGLLAIIRAISGLMLQAAVIYGVVKEMAGEPVTLMDCLTMGLRRWLGVLVLGIVLGLGVMVGFMLFVIPGIILSLMWSVAVPVRVVEGLGIRASLGRSRFLTRGHRLAILLLGLIVVVIAVVIGVVIGVVGRLVPGGSLDLLILSPLLNALLALLGSAGAAVLYQQLREGREGAATDTLAEVFA